MDSVAVILKRLLTGDTHHELLMFEAMLALTNLSAYSEEGSNFREKIVSEGGFRLCIDMVTLENPNDKIRLAAAELISNLALSE